MRGSLLGIFLCLLFGSLAFQPKRAQSFLENKATPIQTAITVVYPSTTVYLTQKFYLGVKVANVGAPATPVPQGTIAIYVDGSRYTPFLAYTGSNINISFPINGQPLSAGSHTVEVDFAVSHSDTRHLNSTLTAPPLVIAPAPYLRTGIQVTYPSVTPSEHEPFSILIKVSNLNGTATDPLPFGSITLLIDGKNYYGFTWGYNSNSNSPASSISLILPWPQLNQAPGLWPKAIPAGSHTVKVQFASPSILHKNSQLNAPALVIGPDTRTLATCVTLMSPSGTSFPQGTSLTFTTNFSIPVTGEVRTLWFPSVSLTDATQAIQQSSSLQGNNYTLNVYYLGNTTLQPCVSNSVSFEIVPDPNATHPGQTAWT